MEVLLKTGLKIIYINFLAIRAFLRKLECKQINETDRQSEMINLYDLCVKNQNTRHKVKAL